MSSRPQLSALLALALVTLPSAAEAQQLSVPAPGSGDYRILVTGVDSSEFPRIKLRFKVIIQGANTQKWHPDMGVKIIEDVQLTKDGEPQLDRAEGRVLGPPELCEIQPVALGMAVDVSGSVTPVMQEIQAGASQESPCPSKAIRPLLACSDSKSAPKTPSAAIRAKSRRQVRL